MIRHWNILTTLILVVSMLHGALAADTARAAEAVQVRIDSEVKPVRATVAGLRGGGARPVAAVADPQGVRSDFIVGEVLLRVDSGKQLNDFLDRYDGEVLYDGEASLKRIPGGPKRQVEAPAWQVIRINPQRAALDGLAANMAGVLALRGEFVFTSEAAARTVAAMVHERAAGLDISLNWVLQIGAVPEHLDSTGVPLDFANWPWMNEDDNLVLPDDQGLSIGIVHAWSYLEYKGHSLLNPWSGDLQKIAIIDVGFALDTSTGEPLIGNLDFMNTLDAPLQFDFVDNDDTAGGEHDDPDSKWHGQSVFSVAAAYSHNSYGVPGSAARFGQPILMKLDLTTGSVIPAFATAIAAGADIVNMSFGLSCNWLCHGVIGLWLSHFQSLLDSANNDHDMIVLANAGNEGIDLDTIDYYPCEMDHVLCVGAIDRLARPQVYNQGGSNFDGALDIWAPDELRGTVNPDTETEPAGSSQLPEVSGTSFATPFVAGISALLKVLDPSLNGDAVKTLLQAAANPSSDPTVAPLGYVDAYKAALEADPNLEPAPQITHPDDGADLSYLPNTGVLVAVNDPESDVFGHDYFALGGIVTVSSDIDGLLCQLDDTNSSCPLPPLSVATHVLTAEATDPHGATGSHAITVRVANRPPSALIVWPPDGSTHGDDQLITFSGIGLDPEQDIAAMTWESSLDGVMGNEPTLHRDLSIGTHTITFTVFDQLGQSDSDSIQINVHAGEGHPSAIIYEPQEQAGSANGVFLLQGNGIDPQEDELSDDKLVWESNLDGVLGTGRILHVQLSSNSCAPNEHVIKLIVTDSEGHSSWVQVRVWAGIVC